MDARLPRCNTPLQVWDRQIVAQKADILNIHGPRLTSSQSLHRPLETVGKIETPNNNFQERDSGKWMDRILSYWLNRVRKRLAPDRFG